MVRKNLWIEWEWSRTQRLQWNQWKENKFGSYHSKLKVLKDWIENFESFHKITLKYTKKFNQFR